MTNEGADRPSPIDPTTPEHALRLREQAVREQAARLDLALHEVREFARQRQHAEAVLRRQIDVLHLVLDSIGEGVIIADETGVLRHFNRAAEEILGLRLVEAPIAEWTERYGCYLPDAVTPYPPADLPLARAVRGETIHEEEVLIRHPGRPDGIWLSVNATPLRDADGEPRGGVAAFRDVTARRRAEHRLAVQYAVTRVLADASGVAETVPRLLEAVGSADGWDVGVVWEVDEAAGVLCCLDVWHAPGLAFPKFEAATRRHAFVPGVGLPGRTWTARELVWLTEVQEDANFPRVSEAIRDGLHSGFAFPLLGRATVLGVVEFFNRTSRTIDTDLHRLLVALGSQIGQFLERKRAEEALRQSHDLLRAIAEGTTDAIFVKDLQGRYLMINPAGARFLGRTVEEVLGRDDSEMFSRETARAIMAGDQRVLDESRPLTCEDVGTVAGVTRTFSSTKAPYRDGCGNVVGLIGISRDVTERRQAEEDLKRTAADLARSNEDLQQFAYVVSHDLREPLRMVSSYCRLLRDRYRDKLDRNADDFLEFAVDGAARMEQLINELLAYARVGTRGKSFAPTDTAAVFDRAIANLRRAIEETGAKVTCGALPTVLADESQLGQLAQNLLANAIKFHGSALPRVYIWAEYWTGCWRFAVRDNGIGIPEADLERIFGVFERLHAAADYPGTGIGLAICKRIIERHGGRIWAESTPGHGTTFYFTLPDHLCPSVGRPGIESGTGREVW